jgi:hypothetical protein
MDHESAPLLRTADASVGGNSREDVRRSNTRLRQASVSLAGVVALVGVATSQHQAMKTAVPLTWRQRLGAGISTNVRDGIIAMEMGKLEERALEEALSGESFVSRARISASDFHQAWSKARDEAKKSPGKSDGICTNELGPGVQTSVRSHLEQWVDTDARAARMHDAIAERARRRTPDDNGPNDNGPNDNGPNDNGPNDNGPNDNGPNAPNVIEDPRSAKLGGNWLSNLVSGFEKVGEATAFTQDVLSEYMAEVDEGSGFCWRDSYTREGILPQFCSDNKEIIADGLFCYDKCSKYGSDYDRYGYDCHQGCKNGWRDDGLLCYNGDASYGRGVGTIECEWSWSTWTLQCGGDLCKRKGKEDYLGLCYDPCKDGYTNFGSNICTMDCQDQGYEGGIAPSCTKHIKISPGMEAATCPPGYEYDGGLCYQPCKAGFTGVAFVCWGDAPTVNGAEWVLCGMGAAVDDATCASIVIDQIMGPLEMVAFFATLGASSGATTAAKVGAKTAAKGAKAISDVGDTVSAIKKTAKSLEDAIGTADTVISTTESVISGVADLVECETEADCIRLSAEVASLFDPTGISSTIAAYSHDICTRYSGDYEPTDEEALQNAQLEAVALAGSLRQDGRGIPYCAEQAKLRMISVGRSEEEAQEVYDTVTAGLQEYTN